MWGKGGVCCVCVCVCVCERERERYIYKDISHYHTEPVCMFISSLDKRFESVQHEQVCFVLYCVLGEKRGIFQCLRASILTLLCMFRVTTTATIQGGER